ncbi:Diphthamide biosynthesis protein 3 [Coemansia sp. RSA 2336]|nr:Diphthamide biosynthesis protein 3 [Coemansia sp. RSA 2336]
MEANKTIPELVVEKATDTPAAAAQPANTVAAATVPVSTFNAQDYPTNSTGFYDEVEIEDMDETEDENGDTIFTYPCPCGDLFIITKEDLELGEDIARCPSCSLLIQVIYNRDDFAPDDAEEFDLQPTSITVC